MDVGMLWYDNDPKRTLRERVIGGIEAYYAKFQEWPNMCYVSAKQWSQEMEFDLTYRGAEVSVITAPNVLIGHFWIGQAEVKVAQLDR